MMVCRCSKLVELAKPTQWSLQGTVNNEVLPIKVEKKGDTFEVNWLLWSINCYLNIYFMDRLFCQLHEKYEYQHVVFKVLYAS